MDLIQLIILIIVLSLPLIILLVPFAIAWIKGKKLLDKDFRKYSRALEISIPKLFGTKSFEFTSKSDLEMRFVAKNSITVSGNIWLVDRRYYFYYIAKLIRPLNDSITLEFTTDRLPGCALMVVSKKWPKVLNQAMAYIESFDTFDVEELKDEYLILTDEPRNAAKVLDAFVIRELKNLSGDIIYLIADYASPNLTIFFEINTKEIHTKIPRILTLAKTLLTNLEKIPPRKTKVEIFRHFRNRVYQLTRKR